MDVFDALTRCSGAARLHRLLALGITRNQLDNALVSGDILRPGPGTYSLPDAGWEYVTAVTTSTLLTCTSAAQHYGLWMRHTPHRLHLVSAQSRTIPGAVVHRVKSLSKPNMAPVATPLECVLHSAKCLPEEAALLIAESALVRKLVSWEELQTAAAGPGSRRVRAVFGLIDSRSQSLLECLSRRVFTKAGLKVTSQAAFTGVGHVDLLIEDRLIVELDGAAFHSDRSSYRRDRSRWNNLTIRGYPVLRFTYEDVMYFPGLMLEQVLSVLAASRPVAT